MTEKARQEDTKSKRKKAKPKDKKNFPVQLPDREWSETEIASAEEYFRRYNERPKPPKWEASKDNPDHVNLKCKFALDYYMGLVGTSEATGAIDQDLITHILNGCISTVPGKTSMDHKANVATAAMHAIRPQNELEGLLAAQMVACHNMAMECAKRAMLQEQTFDGINANINRVIKLMRTFVCQVEALQKLRGKSSHQKVTVEHVHVNEGGQAIVGNVECGKVRGAGDKSKIEE